MSGSQVSIDVIVYKFFSYKLDFLPQKTHVFYKATYFLWYTQCACPLIRDKLCPKVTFYQKKFPILAPLNFGWL